jgi:hypothetical protein
MDVRNEQLLKVRSDDRNFEFNSKTYLSQKAGPFTLKELKEGTMYKVAQDNKMHNV